MRLKTVLAITAVCTAAIHPVRALDAQEEVREHEVQGEQAVTSEADTGEGHSAASAPVERWEAPVHLAGPSLEELVRQAFPEDPDTAVRIVTCESQWNPQARSRTGDSGLFQINDIHRGPSGHAAGMSVEDLFDPMVNIRVARALYEESGWYPWVCF